MYRRLKTNTRDLGEYFFVTQIDVKGLETYNKAMIGSHTQ